MVGDKQIEGGFVRLRDEQFRSSIDRARQGSPEDFGQLMSECRTYLLLVASQELDASVIPKEGVSDVVQNTFLEAQQGFASFRGATPEELKGWLRQILRRQIVDLRRRYKQSKKRKIEREVSLDTSVDIDTRELAIESKDPTPSSQALREEQLHQLREALRKIPESQAMVVVMHHRDGLEFSDIALRLDKSEAAVRKLWGRGIKALQAEISRRNK